MMYLVIVNIYCAKLSAKIMAITMRRQLQNIVHKVSKTKLDLIYI